jgi:protein XRP2
MGCVNSKSEDAPQYTFAGGGRVDGGIIVGSSAAFAKDLDPKAFVCTNRTGEAFVKAPGTVNGQQFVIADCADCDIFICDHCEMVTIDRCTNCRIFIGPCESSIFVRNCQDTKLVAACRQFRSAAPRRIALAQPGTRAVRILLSGSARPGTAP